MLCPAGGCPMASPLLPGAGGSGQGGSPAPLGPGDTWGHGEGAEPSWGHGAGGPREHRGRSLLLTTSPRPLPGTRTAPLPALASSQCSTGGAGGHPELPAPAPSTLRSPWGGPWVPPPPEGLHPVALVALPEPGAVPAHTPPIPRTLPAIGCRQAHGWGTQHEATRELWQPYEQHPAHEGGPV